MSMPLFVYLLLAFVVALIATMSLTCDYSATERATDPQARLLARILLASPVWPLLAVWALVWLVRSLWRIAFPREVAA